MPYSIEQQEELRTYRIMVVVYKEAIRTGPLDFQGRVVKARTAGTVALLLARHAQGQQWIPPGSPSDPRIYAKPASPASISKMLRSHGVKDEHVPKSGKSDQWPASPKRIKLPKAAITKLAIFIADHSEAEEELFTWQRDIRDWLTKKRAISPDKLRRLAIALGASWIEAFRDAGYYQHLVAVIGVLLEKRRFREAFVVVAFIFPYWSTLWRNTAQGIAIADLAENLHSALLEVENILRNTAEWKVIPARVKSEHIADETVRCVFRLCEPQKADSKPEDRAIDYPSGPVRDASAYLLRRTLKPQFGGDLSDIKSLLEIVCGKKRATELASMRGAPRRGAHRRRAR